MRGWYLAFICSRLRAAVAAVMVVACVALAGCTSVIPVPTTVDSQWAQQRWPETTVATLEHGRALYVSKCSGCHSLYVPTRVPATRWPAMIDEMTRRANLLPDQRDLILRYLLTASRNAPASSGGT